MTVSLYFTFGILCAQNRSLFVIVYFGVCICVVFILLLRLYFTFRNSMYEINKYQKLFFVVMVCLGVIAAIINVLTYSVLFNLTLRLFTLAFLAIAYLGGTIYAMFLFAQKMYKLTKLRQSSSRNVFNNGKNPTVFNKFQKKLLYTTSKYVTLLTIALISTWISASASITANILYGDEEDYNKHWIVWVTAGIMICIDCVINIICLSLQYPFADKYYKKYCICFGNCCMYLVTRSLMKEFDVSDLEDQNYNSNLTTVDDTDTSVKVDINMTLSEKSKIESKSPEETMNEDLRMPTTPIPKEEEFEDLEVP